MNREVIPEPSLTMFPNRLNWFVTLKVAFTRKRCPNPNDNTAKQSAFAHQNLSTPPQINMKKSCVAICNGPWQMILALASLMTRHGTSAPERSFHLVCLTKGLESNATTALKQLSSQLSWWSTVHSVNTDGKASDFNSCAKTITNQLNTLRVDELWIPTATKFEFTYFLDNFRDANCYIYEDGISSGDPHFVTGRDNPEPNAEACRLLRRTYRSLMASLRIAPYYEKSRNRLSHLNAIQKGFQTCYLSTPLAAAVRDFPYRVREIDSQHIFDILTQLKLNVAQYSIPLNAHWILDGNLSWQKLLSFEQELEVYCRLITYFHERREAVVWKPHPRSKSRLTEAILDKSHGEVCVVPESASGLPVELFYSNCRPQSVIGFSSTSLLNASMYGINAFTLLRDITSLNNENRPGSYARKLCETNVAPIQNLIPQF